MQTLREHLHSPSVSWLGLCCSLFCMLSYYVSVRLEFHVMMSVTISAYKRCLNEGSFLICISCVCMHIVLLNTYCVVFLLCLSLFCVSCTKCCQFLLVVHLWKNKIYTCSLKEINILSTSRACPVFISIYTSTFLFPSLIQLQSAILTS
jgi:hypothetical protein